MAKMSIGKRVFNTKAESTAEVRRILHSAMIDMPLVDDERELITDLYAMHPFGHGVPVMICVSINIYNGMRQRGFRVTFADGSDHRFSYKAPLTPSYVIPNIIGAMREAITASQHAVKAAVFGAGRTMVCSSEDGGASGVGCGKMIAWERAHVHHMTPKFRDIAASFIERHGKPELREGGMGNPFADPAVERQWVEYHDSVARRIVVCDECNREDERRDPR